MSNAIHPLDFDEERLNTYYRTRDALTALVEYHLLPVPGTELYDECTGWGCADGCGDCRGCPECFTAHDIQDCPAIRERLFS
jgi:hypothetical protein